MRAASAIFEVLVVGQFDKEARGTKRVAQILRGAKSACSG